MEYFKIGESYLLLNPEPSFCNFDTGLYCSLITTSGQQNETGSSEKNLRCLVSL